MTLQTAGLQTLAQQLEQNAPALDADLRRSLARLGAGLAMKKAEEAKAAPEKPSTAKILQFPLPFGEDTRAAANPLVHSALFAAIQRKDRHLLNDCDIGVLTANPLNFPKMR